MQHLAQHVKDSSVHLAKVEHCMKMLMKVPTLTVQMQCYCHDFKSMTSQMTACNGQSSDAFPVAPREN